MKMFHKIGVFNFITVKYFCTSLIKPYYTKNSDSLFSCHGHLRVFILTRYHRSRVIQYITRSSAVTKRPCDCCVGQFGSTITGRRYSADIIGLFSTTVM